MYVGGERQLVDQVQYCFFEAHMVPNFDLLCTLEKPRRYLMCSVSQALFHTDAYLFPEI